MSLSDHLRYLRAMRGGSDTRTIAAAIDLEKPASVNRAETQYRPVRDPELVAKLADFYGRPLEEFQWHNARPRKFLTFYAARALETKETASFTLRSGETLSGQIVWWDLGSIGLEVDDGRTIVIMRHAVVDWPDATNWEDV
ncbi:MAG: hypothetical protein GY803_01780 [Chloroflexi bacterium]|nr:hypothetical protein [Chloroflexota bacterium]